MKIHQLTLKNFRNYEQLELLFKEGANVFVGQNGQGKTNVLEAISLLSVGRSFRTARTVHDWYETWKIHQKSCQNKLCPDWKITRLIWSVEHCCVFSRWFEIGKGRSKREKAVFGSWNLTTKTTILSDSIGILQGVESKKYFVFKSTGWEKSLFRT